MKTQDNDTVDTQAGLPTSARRRSHRWIAGVGAFIVVALVVGLSAVVFAQLAQHRSGQTTLPSGQWVTVLKGYTISSLVAARDNPSVLYACVTSSPDTSSSGQTIHFTVLRSSDGGTHWQNVGSNAGLINSCEIAVNPANSNEIYAVSAANNMQSADVLKHSTDGGQTWNTIVPNLQLPGSNSPSAWDVQQISIEGNHLFGIEWVPLRALPIGGQGGTIPQVNALARLITSADGGHNWTVLGNQLNDISQNVRDYAVDPSNPSTIYEVVGTPWYPIIPRIAIEPADVFPWVGFSGQLYKSTDSGATWKLLLNDLPFGAQVQLASGKPQVVYVGGFVGPIPYLPRLPESPAYPAIAGYFRLSMSNDGGAHWREVTTPERSFGILNWFVSADGQLYVGRLQIVVTGSPTAIKGTVGPAAQGTLSPKGSINGGPPVAVGNGGTPVGSIAIGNGVVPTSTVDQQPSIARYDPTTNAWSNITSPPSAGTLLAVTAASVNGGTVLWFVGSVNGGEVLYRYVVAP